MMAHIVSLSCRFGYLFGQLTVVHLLDRNLRGQPLLLLLIKTVQPVGVRKL